MLENKYKIIIDKNKKFNVLPKVIVRTDVNPKLIKGNSIAEFVTRREPPNSSIRSNKSGRNV